MFGLVAREIIMHRVPSKTIERIQRQAEYLAVRPEVVARDWLLERLRTGNNVSIEEWVEEMARKRLGVLFLDSVRDPGQAIALHLHFLEDQGISLDFPAHRVASEMFRRIEGGERWAELRPSLVRRFTLRAASLLDDLEAFVVPPTRSLGEGLLLTKPELLHSANNAGLLLGTTQLAEI